ncbi:MAG: pilus assembly protein PilP [Desulfobacterales bacterium]|nr:pilus assembly protein PilP [Desulfobacterales bacterium]
MMKPIDIKRCLVLGACLLAAVTMGCEKEPQAPSKPNVVVKKIAVAQKVPVATANPAKAKPAAPEPAPAAPEPAPAVPSASQPDKAAASVPAQAAEAKSTATAESVTAPSAGGMSAGSGVSEALPVPPTPEGVAATDAPIAKKPSGIGGLAMMVRPRTYDPEGRVNPFTPLFQKQAEAEEETKTAKGRQRQPRVPQTPLEKVDLAQLKLVAVMQMQSGPRALVEESSGKGYVVRKGTYMGLHSGQVVEIAGDRVVVEEEVKSLLGDFEIKKRELKLQKPLGE